MLSVDLLVLGGGINGAGIARDAAGRDLKVALVEMGDVGGATSSASSKLIHGGLRYLETYDIALVRESLKEREILARAAPHLVQPLTLALPHDAKQRPRWMIRLGLFLYDFLAASRRFPKARGVALDKGVLGAPLKPEFARGFTYGDGWTDDARLVLANAQDAAERGAVILPRTRAVGAEARNGAWRVTVDGVGGRYDIAARVLVNAAGPWAAKVDRDVLGIADPPKLRLIKGSHIVVPRLYVGEHGYLLQATDGRVVFVLPYTPEFNLIGTTEVEVPDMAHPPAITGAEVEYLLATVARYFHRAPTAADVAHSFAGVRPLYDDGRGSASKISREYVLTLRRLHQAPALSVYGGKLTTYRALAEKALAKLTPHLPGMGPPWTHAGVLPGGDFLDGVDGLLARLRQRAPWLAPEVAERWAHAYGERAFDVLGGAQARQDLGAEVIPGLFAQELQHLVRSEWAHTAEDILWRRTRLGLTAPAGAAELLRAWLERRRLK